LLLQRLLQHLRPELSQCGLHVAATQAARGRCALQDGLLALPCQSLEQRALLNACDGLLLRLCATQADEVLHTSERWLTSLHIRLEQTLHLIELPALFLDAHLGCTFLSASGFAGSARLHRASEKLRSTRN
jgi:hypothetical protein